ncbi:MAG TPA: chlorite dismutase family protein [Candidatus Limnocylindria bacterium]|jgi:chlorite dismutase|nr:chlorite dismutase family protein [Candidatus Limnocylindria bacterium]
MSEERFVQALLLRLDPAWRRLPADQRAADAADFQAAAERAAGRLAQHHYSTIGLRAEGELLVWRLADSIETIEETAADMLRSGLGCWLSSSISLVGLTRPSQYVKRPTAQEQSLFAGERSRYLVVYPFVKSIDWYLMPADERQQVMAGHMKVGHRYPQVRQLLAYSFGLDDQEFIVAYETDDLVGFQDLVRELRGTESRRATVRDTPIITGIHRPLADILAALGGER